MASQPKSSFKLLIFFTAIALVLAVVATLLWSSEKATAPLKENETVQPITSNQDLVDVQKDLEQTNLDQIDQSLNNLNETSLGF